jgi:hypothetical protein
VTESRERIEDFIYSYYINKVCEDYHNGIISDNEFQQYVETLDRWECNAERLSMGRLDKLKNVLGKN